MTNETNAINNPPLPPTNQSPAGSVAGSKRPGQQEAVSIDDDVLESEFGKVFSLKVVLSKWWRRANSGPNARLANFTSYATTVRRGDGSYLKRRGGGRGKRKGSGTGRVYVGPKDLAKRFLSQTELYEEEVKTHLEGKLGRELPWDEPFYHFHQKLQSVMSTLRDYAWESAELPDVEAKIQGFTNLKLFLENADELHSWRSTTKKVKGTVDKIPKIVLMNASEDVTFEDYARADHLKEGRGKRPLLSFGIEFKATKSWFGTKSWLGKGKDSRAYRTNLRAITASALLLGGVKTALKVKQLLTDINNLPTLKDGKTREAMVQSALDRLGKHGDVNALISDLSFELERHSIQAAYDARYNDSYANKDENEFYSEVRDNLQKLDDLPNRTIIIQNMAKNILKKEEGYTHDPEQFPSNVIRDLVAATKPNPMFHLLHTQSSNADSARSAIKCWTDLMVQEGTNARNDIEREMARIDEQSEAKSREIYRAAAKSFANNVFHSFSKSPEDQAALMVLCLKNPGAKRAEFRSELKSIKARRQQNRPDPVPKDKALLSQAPSHADEYSKRHAGNDNGDDDIKYDTGTDVIGVVKEENGKDEIQQSVKQNNNSYDNTEETKEDINQDQLIKASQNKSNQNNNEKNVKSGGDNQPAGLDKTDSEVIKRGISDSSDDSE